MINFPAGRAATGGTGAPQAPVTWKVSAQAEAVAPNGTGQLVSGVRVYFELSNGLAASVFVPHSDYTAEAVKRLILDRVAQITEVGNLGGSITGGRAT